MKTQIIIMSLPCHKTISLVDCLRRGADYDVLTKCNKDLNLSSLYLYERNCILVDSYTFHLDDFVNILNQARLLHSKSRQFFCVLFNVSELTEKQLLKRYEGWYLFKGLFKSDSSEKNILKGISKVLTGEYWLPRSFMQSYIEKNNQKQGATNSTAIIHDTLTPKEVEILSSICNGMSNTEVANSMHISKHTVKAHVYNIFRKLNVKNRMQAANWYQEQSQQPHD